MRQSEARFLARQTSFVAQFCRGAFACMAGAGGLTLAFLDALQDFWWFVPMALASVGLFAYGVSVLRDVNRALDDR